MTWNVTGIMSSLGYLGDAIVNNSVYICGISEHWLFPQNLYILDCSYRLQRTCSV